MELDTGITPSPQINGTDDTEAPVPPLLASLDPATNQPAAFAEMWQHVIDGLTEQIALLDEDWNILVVNRSWAKVVELYGHFALIPGTDYLQFCREMAAGGLRAAID